MILSEEEIVAILGLIATHHTKAGFGYADEQPWASIQGKLSIMLEVVRRRMPVASDQQREDV